jgi:hypothetical protein
VYLATSLRSLRLPDCLMAHLKIRRADCQ